jgi:hypothetical protein
MMKIKFDKFSGVMPLIDNKKLPDIAAIQAQNLDIRSLRLEPLKTLEPATLTGWKAKALEANTDVVLSPVHDDQYQRYYYTGHSTGKLRVAGTFGERDVALPLPAAPGVAYSGPPTISTSTSNWSFMFIFGPSIIRCMPLTPLPTGWPSGTPSGRFYDHYISWIDSDTIEVKIRYDGEYIAGTPSVCTSVRRKLYSWQFSKELPDEPGVHDCSTDILAESAYFNLTDSLGEIYATFKADSMWEEDLGAPSGVTPPSAPYLTLNRRYFYLRMKRTITKETKYYYYVASYVNDIGEESPPSPVSGLFTVTGGQFPKPTFVVGPGSPIVSRRIYRTASGATYTNDNFYWVADIAQATTSYIDYKKDSDLGEKMPVYGNPPDNMNGLVVFNNSLTAFKGKDIFFSEPNIANVWPVKYQITMEYDIMALAVNGNDMAVLTKGNPSVVTGYHPDSYSVAKMAFPQSCVAQRSACVGRNMVFYASPDGICAISGASGVLITDKFYSRADWQLLTPSTIKAAVHDDILTMFHSSGGLCFNFEEGLSSLTNHDETCDKLLLDLETDALYLAKTGVHYSWNAGASNRTLTWRSKNFQFPAPMTFSACKIIADGYTAPIAITLTLYANNVSVWTFSGITELSFRLPILRRERLWSFQISSNTPIDEFQIATSIGELKQ